MPLRAIVPQFIIGTRTTAVMVVRFIEPTIKMTIALSTSRMPAVLFRRQHALLAAIVACTLTVACHGADVASPVVGAGLDGPEELALIQSNRYLCSQAIRDGAGNITTSRVRVAYNPTLGDLPAGGEELVPAFFTQLSRHKPNVLSRVRCVLPSGEDVNEYAFRFIRQATGGRGRNGATLTWTDDIIWCTDVPTGAVCNGVYCANAMTSKGSGKKSSLDANASRASFSYSGGSMSCDNGCTISGWMYSCGGGGGWSGGVGDGDGGGGGGGGGGGDAGNGCENCSDNLEEAIGGCPAAVPTQPLSPGTFAKGTFGTVLRNNANSKPLGQCAYYVAQALCSAGITSVCTGSADAKNWNALLPQIGFVPLSGTPSASFPEHYQAQIGDIAVFIYEPCGHVAAWDGHDWVSDFVQQTVFPNSNNQTRPFIIWRRP